MNITQKISVLIFIGVVTLPPSVKAMNFHGKAIVQNNKKRTTLHDGEEFIQETRNKHARDKEDLIKAVKDGDFSKVVSLVGTGMDIDKVTDSRGTAALRIAIAGRKTSIIEKLVENGATISSEDLDFFANYCHFAKPEDNESSILNYLITKTNKSVALHDAIISQNNTLVKYILPHKPVLTPSLLALAANHNHPVKGNGVRIAQQLIAAGLKYNAQEVLKEVSPDKLNENFQFYGDMKDLIEKNNWVADTTGVFKRRVFKKTDLIDAVEKDDLSAVKHLISDANIHATNDVGETAFSIAVKQGKRAIVDNLAYRYLIDRRCNGDYQTVDYILAQKPNVPTCIVGDASMVNDHIMVKKLIDSGIDYQSDQDTMERLKYLIMHNYMSPEVKNLLNIDIPTKKNEPMNVNADAQKTHSVLFNIQNIDITNDWQK